jgi:AcrR family transcriptional regulator
VARLKSEDRRNAILLATTKVVAERGVGASTSAIAGVAGVGEGSLFTYFKSKDELLNVLYREIKLDMANAMMSGFPRRLSIRHRLQHVWNGYVDWGVQNPSQNRALRQIGMWAGLTKESKTAGSAPFLEIRQIADEATQQHLLRDVPLELVGATVRALAEMTMGLLETNPEKALEYRDAGFQMLWAAISKKR